MGLARDEGWAIPFDAPFYAPLPAWYRNVQFQEVFFRADPAQVARLLPEPLEPSADGACVAIGLRVPFSSAYGGFNEVIYQEKAVFRGRPGWYCSHLLHDGPRGIAAGREIYGTPKIFAELEVRFVESTMLTRGAVAGVPVVTIISTMEQPIAPSALPALTPSWRLKLIPRADRPEPAIKQLIDGAQATHDLVVHAAYRGRGTVHLEPSPLADLTGLRPLEFSEAFAFEASYSEGFATIAYDYLVGE